MPEPAPPGHKGSVLIDSHCHLESFVRHGTLAAALARAAEAGVSTCITVGTSLRDWALYRELAAAYPGVVHHTAGLHPCDVGDDWETQLAALPAAWERARPGPLPVALGECGLDRFHLPAQDEAAAARLFSRQQEAFARQLALARQIGCPVVVHSRGAHRQCIEMVDASGVDWRRVVFHCFVEGPTELAELRARGGEASFTGIVTYKSAENLRAAVAAHGPGGTMVETDAPYLAPVPHRGKPNEPAWVVHTARACARILGQEEAVFAAASTARTRAFYGLG